MKNPFFAVVTSLFALTLASCAKESPAPDPEPAPEHIRVEITSITRYPPDREPVGCVVDVFYRVQVDSLPQGENILSAGICTLTASSGDPTYCDTVPSIIGYVPSEAPLDEELELPVPFLPPGENLRIRPFVETDRNVYYGKTIDWSMPAIPTDDNCIELPVVFHLLCDDPASVPRNFSREVLDRTMANANLALRNAMPARAEWDRGTDTHIRLVRAGTDPSGRPLATPGLNVVRHPDLPLDPKAFLSTPATIDAPCWDPYRYLNVWIFPYNEEWATAAAGMAVLPTMPSLHPLEGLESSDYYADHPLDFNTGVSLNADYVYSLLNSEVSGHEIGHYLGLFHAFSAEGCGTDDDYCDDTRDYDYAAFMSQPDHYFTASRIDCVDGTEFYSFNMMDYNCFATQFTPDQNRRMQQALQYGYFIPGSETGRRRGLTKSPPGAVRPAPRIVVTPPRESRQSIRK